MRLLLMDDGTSWPAVPGTAYERRGAWMTSKNDLLLLLACFELVPVLIRALIQGVDSLYCTAT